jgi:hypothetical protein
MRLRLLTAVACALVLGETAMGQTPAPGSDMYYNSLTAVEKAALANTMQQQKTQVVLPAGFTVPLSNPCKFMSEPLVGTIDTEYVKVRAVMDRYMSISATMKLTNTEARLNGLTEAEHADLRAYKEEYDIQTFTTQVISEQCRLFARGVFVAMGPEFQLDYYARNEIQVIDSPGVRKHPLLGLAVLLLATGMSHVASQY